MLASLCTKPVSTSLPGIILQLGQQAATGTGPQQSPMPGVVQLLQQLCSALHNLYRVFIR